MKFQNILPLAIVGSSLSQLVSAINEKTEVQQILQIEESVTFDMPQDFRETKKVLFSAMFGGSSHVHWVISILDELSSRGHNTSFITKVTILISSKLKSFSYKTLNVVGPCKIFSRLSAYKNDSNRRGESNNWHKSRKGR